MAHQVQYSIWYIHELSDHGPSTTVQYTHELSDHGPSTTVQYTHELSDHGSSTTVQYTTSHSVCGLQWYVESLWWEYPSVSGLQWSVESLWWEYPSVSGLQWSVESLWWGYPSVSGLQWSVETLWWEYPSVSGLQWSVESLWWGYPSVSGLQWSVEILWWEYPSVSGLQWSVETLSWEYPSVISPILLTLGTVGNILTIIVWSRRDMRSSQATVYLVALSVADILVLNAGLLRHFVREICGFDIRKFSEASCKINTILVYTSLDVSVWILVAFTLERILSVYLPHKVKTYCTRVTSLVVVAVIIVVFTGLNSHFLYGTGSYYGNRVGNETVMKHCGPLTEAYGRFLYLTWPWIDFCVFSLVPITIISVGNTCIVVRVWMSRRRTLGLDSMSTTTSVKLSQGMENAELDHRLPKRSLKLHRSSSMTAIVLVLNVMFLVTTTPVSVFFIVMPTWRSRAASERDFAQIYLTFALVNLVQYVNNSCNFIMYCMAGSKFRRVLRGIFHRRRVFPLEARQELRQIPYEDRNAPEPKINVGVFRRLPVIRSVPTIYINDMTDGTRRRLTEGELK
ncbi:hypothetical protein Btru_023958 [Bulinus truncatus]|nr:hypothetical protein Btru_023958 [Bulinus truncatus]